MPPTDTKQTAAAAADNALAEFDRDIAARLGPDSTIDDQIRVWYRERVPWAKMSGGELGDEFRQWALETMEQERTRSRPNRYGWGVMAMAVATHTSLAAAARACGVGRRTLSRLMNERPEFSALVDIAEAELFKGVGERRVDLRNKAVTRIERCLESDDDRVALRAAQLLASGLGQ